MKFMIPLIKNEFRTRAKKYGLFLFLGVVGLIQVLLITAILKIFKFDQLPNNPFIATFFRFYNVLFFAYSTMLIPVSAAVIGYYIISVEYISNTWEFLLLGIKDKKKVLMSKYIVSLIIFWIQQLVIYGVFSIIQVIYFKQQLDGTFMVLGFFTVLFFQVVLFTAQIVLQYFSNNGVVATVCAVVFVMLFFLMPRGTSNIFVEKILMLTPTYIGMFDTFNVVNFIGGVVVNLLVASGMLSVAIYKFKL